MTARYDWTINQGETSTLVYTRFQSDGTTAQNFVALSTFRIRSKSSVLGAVIKILLWVPRLVVAEEVDLGVRLAFRAMENLQFAVGDAVGLPELRAPA